MSNVEKQPKDLTPVQKPLELSTRDQAELRRKAMRDKEREMVKGIFRDYECAGGEVSFSFKKYKEDPIENFTLKDGQVYTVPLGVAKHLNMNCNYGVHEYSVDAEGRKIQVIGQKVHRYGFSSLDFMDPEALGMKQSNIVTVQHVA